jgi:UDP-N-acetylglucosamine 2-epimerase (non-hydrolysing)
MKKIALVFGTRPEAIKLAPVYLELRRRPQTFEPLIWATAQHREMLDHVMDAFDLKADRDFNLMKPSQTLTGVTTAVLEAMERALAEERPDCIVVQGDTTTTLAGALAAYYAQVAVAHVEAGLRTKTKYSPFPEEINRRLTTRLADYHFAATPWARDNLEAEGVRADRVWITGNTVIDALDAVARKVRDRAPAFPDDFPREILEGDGRMILITGHRRESFGEGFESICRAVAELAGRYPQTHFVYPVHLNPNVREPVFRLLGARDNIHLTEPLDYEPFIWAMARCHFLLSDSGGVQEEAPHLGKPVLVMRETTERPEGIDAGVSRLVGVDFDKIVGESSSLLDDPQAYEAMSRAVNPYGDGKASERIAEALGEIEC